MKRQARVISWMLGAVLVASSALCAGAAPKRPDMDDPGNDYSAPKADSTYAEIVVRHAEPDKLEVVISSSDRKSGDIRVPMRAMGADPARRDGFDESQRDWQMAIGRIDLSRHANYLDGRHPWVLRLTDHSRRGGELSSFTIVVKGQATSMSDGSQTFAGNRGLTAMIGEPASTRHNKRDSWGPGPAVDPSPDPWNPNHRPDSNQPASRPDDPYANDTMGVLSTPTWVDYNARATVTAWVAIPEGRHRTLEVTMTMPVGWRLAHPSPENGELQRQSNVLHWKIADPKPGRIQLKAELVAPKAQRGLGGSYPVYGMWSLDGYGVHYMSGSRNINLGGYGPGEPQKW